MSHPYECNSGQPLTDEPCHYCGRSLADATDREVQQSFDSSGRPPRQLTVLDVFWISVAVLVICLPWFAGVIWLVDWLIHV